MHVEQVMNRNVRSASGRASLQEVVGLMRDNDCGWIPIINLKTGRPVGALTDRDIALFAARMDRPLSKLGAREAMSGPLASCSPYDDIRDAEQKMADRRGRRLAVRNDGGALIGVLALDDLVSLSASEVAARTTGLEAKRLTNTLARVVGPARNTSTLVSGA